MAIDAIQVERQVQSAKRAALVVEAADLAINTVRSRDRVYASRSAALTPSPRAPATSASWSAGGREARLPQAVGHIRRQRPAVDRLRHLRCQTDEPALRYQRVLDAPRPCQEDRLDVVSADHAVSMREVVPLR